MPDPKTPPAKTPATTTTFYRDTLDDALYRVGPDGIADVLHPDGSWHAYPDVDLHTGAMPITPAAAQQLAGTASLTAARSASAAKTAARSRARTPART